MRRYRFRIISANGATPWRMALASATALAIAPPTYVQEWPDQSTNVRPPFLATLKLMGALRAHPAVNADTWSHSRGTIVLSP